LENFSGKKVRYLKADVQQECIKVADYEKNISVPGLPDGTF
jgi:hypothetical protein